TANVIESNQWGVKNFTGRIQFNRFIANGTAAIEASDDQLIAHNTFDRNPSVGIHLDLADRVRVIGNTMYAPAGDNIKAEHFSSELEVRDNILWAENGLDITLDNT